MALALAPVCAWVAVTGRLAPGPPSYMFAAVLTWTAGFDIIYACQDYQVDIESNGSSPSPPKSESAHALWISRTYPRRLASP